jgi:hypothetical protein
MTPVSLPINFLTVIPGGAQRQEGDPGSAVQKDKWGCLVSLPVPLRGTPGTTPVSLPISFLTVIPGGAQRREGDPDFEMALKKARKPGFPSRPAARDAGNDTPVIASAAMQFSGREGRANRPEP